jgi:hypothetical protein
MLLNSNVRISTQDKKSMTLPKNGKKLTLNEEKSMKIALKEVGIRAIHPERMEALADYLVEKVKSQNK